MGLPETLEDWRRVSPAWRARANVLIPPGGYPGERSRPRDPDEARALRKLGVDRQRPFGPADEASDAALQIRLAARALRHRWTNHRREHLCKPDEPLLLFAGSVAAQDLSRKSVELMTVNHIGDHAKLRALVYQAIMDDGSALNVEVPGHEVRPATNDDLGACNELCCAVHGYDRSAKVADAIGQGSATLVERGGRVCGYATMVGFSGHAVGENNEALMALIGAAPEFVGPGFLLPTGNGELFRWCLEHGLRVVQQMTYMSLGAYDEPTGPYLPSILA